MAAKTNNATCKTIAVSNLKGGVGKTMTAASLGVGLARQGKKTLLIDADSQHSLTVSLGVKEPDKLPVTLASVMNDIINEREIDPAEGIVRHAEGVDLLPANSHLTGIELALAPLIDRELVLRQYIEAVKPLYDFILIDTLCAQAHNVSNAELHFMLSGREDVSGIKADSLLYCA
jgi:chromosome partitioning protein